MKRIHTGHVLVGLALLGLGLDIGLALRSALASRNSSGTMSAINGPYVTGQVISSTAVNARLSDIESELTNSLSRDNKGQMRAQLGLFSGTSTAPGMGFASEATTGIYRNGAGDIRFAFNGTDVQKWGATAVNFPVQVAVGGAQDATTQAEILAAGSQWSGSNIGQNLVIKGSRNNAIGIFDSAGANPWAITNAGGIIFATMPALSDSASAITQYLKVSTAGLAIGATGTAISASYEGSTSNTPAALGANGTEGVSITVTGAAAGAVCSYGVPAGTSKALNYTCEVTSADTCLITITNSTAGLLTPKPGTHRCRVWNP